MLNLLAILVQKYKYWRRKPQNLAAGAQFTCCTSTKVQILTQKTSKSRSLTGLCLNDSSIGDIGFSKLIPALRDHIGLTRLQVLSLLLSLLASLVQKYKYRRRSCSCTALVSHKLLLSLLALLVQKYTYWRRGAAAVPHGHHRCCRPRTHGHAPDSGAAWSKTSGKVSSYSCCVVRASQMLTPPTNSWTCSIFWLLLFKKQISTKNKIHTQVLVYIFIHIQAERQSLMAACAPVCTSIFIAFCKWLYYWFCYWHSGGTAEFDGMEAQPAHLCAPAFLQHFASDFTTGFTTGTQAERQSLTAWKHSLRTSVLQRKSDVGVSCQYLYFCTSKAQVNWVLSQPVCQYLYFCTKCQYFTFVLVKQVHWVPCQHACQYLYLGTRYPFLHFLYW